MRFTIFGCAALAIIAAVVASVTNLQAQSRPDAAQRRVAEGNLVGHGGPVKAIAVSEDGTRALTGSFDYAAILWDITVEPPKALLRLDDHNAAVNAVAFVPASTRALTAGDDSIVRLWDLATGKLLHKFEGHDAGSKIVGLSVSRDGKLAASAGWDRTARLWNLQTLTVGAVLRDEHRGPVNAVVIGNAHADGLPRHVYTAAQDGRLRVFDSGGRYIVEALKHGWGLNVMTPVRALDTSSSDHILVGALDGSAFVIEGNQGVVSRALPTSQRPILSVSALSRPGLVATGGGDGVVRVMRVEDGSVIEQYKNPFGPVWALAIRPQQEGKPIGLYYGGLDDFVTLWQVSPRKPFEDVDASQYPRRFQQAGKSDDPIAKGEIQFARKCSICHTLTPDSANRAGPTLHNVFGRRIATLPGYPFSPELKTLDIVWNADTIAKLFELGPDKFTPGSKMPLQVMSDKGERDALIAFLAVATK